MLLPSGPRARRLTVALYLLMGLALVAAASAFSQWQHLDQVAKGGVIPTALAAANDGRHLALDFAASLGHLLCGLLYWNWLYNSVRNVHEVRGIAMQATPGWAIAYWFIPIVNLFRPYQTVRDLWTASSGGISVKLLPPPILPWWLAYLASGVFEGISDRMQGPDVFELRTSASLELIGRVVFVLAGYLLVRIIAAIDAAQAEWPE